LKSQPGAQAGQAVERDHAALPPVALTGEPGQNTGCPATQEEVDYWIKVLKATTDMTGEELALVAKVFKR